jgi:N-acetylglucosaminyl-diphospho-decaprenol L-rhamnosyltransferase
MSMARGEGADPRVAVVIVTYNNADVLPGALESLPSKGVRLEAVVVADNASVDESARIAESTIDLPIRVVQLGRNAGYAAAINAGVATLNLDQLDAVFVMNPDCRLRPDSLALLARDLLRPQCGISVPRLVNPDGSLQPSLRRMPTVGRALAEAVLGGTTAGRIGRLGELITDPAIYERPGPAVWATGAAMMIASRVLRELGPWDESFFLYSEETEYCLRASDHGYLTWYDPESVVVHIGGDSGVNPALATLIAVNKVRLFRRRHKPLVWSAYYLSTLAGEAFRALAGRPTSRAAVAGLVRRSRRRDINHKVPVRTVRDRV